VRSKNKRFIDLQTYQPVLFQPFSAQIFANSLSSSSHFASFQESISIAAAIILSVNCSLLISRENIATFFQAYQTF